MTGLRTYAGKSAMRQLDRRIVGPVNSAGHFAGILPIEFAHYRSPFKPTRLLKRSDRETARFIPTL
jgi:hypothetical protein